MRSKHKAIIVIMFMSITLMSGCKNSDAVGPDPVDTAALTQTGSHITSLPEITSAAVTAAISEIIAEEVDKTESEYGEYVYSPPDAALAVGFVRDNIIHKLEYTYYRNDGTAELPEYILSDINAYADEWISNAEDDYKLDWIGVDMFDINSDGRDDYIVVGQLMDTRFISKEPGDAPYAPVEIIYATDENGGLESINFSASYGKAATHNDHILSTKTNGYNDFIGSSHDGFLLISFDGKSTYSKVETLSNDYTWKYLDNGLVKLSCYDYRNENEIAVVKFLYDTGYTENIMLYSSLPDGTPSVSVPDAYGSNIFEFYAKRTDKAPEKWNDWAAGPIEIKYISINSGN